MTELIKVTYDNDRPVLSRAQLARQIAELTQYSA